jgi:hypothetical protein
MLSHSSVSRVQQSCDGCTGNLYLPFGFIKIANERLDDLSMVLQPFWTLAAFAIF